MDYKPASKNFGFTLIELLVSILVISILVGLGYANFRAYSRKQALWAAARQIEGDLKLAQSYAMSGKDASCSSGYFYGYSFYRNSSTSYQIRSVCRSAADGAYSYTTISTKNLPSGFEIPTSVNIIFKAVTGGVDNMASFQVRRSSTTNPYITISVSLSGMVTMSYTD